MRSWTVRTDKTGQFVFMDIDSIALASVVGQFRHNDALQFRLRLTRAPCRVCISEPSHDSCSGP